MQPRAVRDNSRAEESTKCLDCKNGYFCFDGLSFPCKAGKFGAPILVHSRKRIRKHLHWVPCRKIWFQTGTAQGANGLLNVPQGKVWQPTRMSNTSGYVEEFCPEACPWGNLWKGSNACRARTVLFAPKRQTEQLLGRSLDFGEFQISLPCQMPPPMLLPWGSEWTQYLPKSQCCQCRKSRRLQHQPRVSSWVKTMCWLLARV